jgi:hypothetical protein
MAPKKKAAEKAAAPKAPAKTAAAAEKDKEERPSVYRTDLGESLPPQAPPVTATDKTDKKK